MEELLLYMLSNNYQKPHVLYNLTIGKPEEKNVISSDCLVSPLLMYSEVLLS